MWPWNSKGFGLKRNWSQIGKQSWNSNKSECYGKFRALKNWQTSTE